MTLCQQGALLTGLIILQLLTFAVAFRLPASPFHQYVPERTSALFAEPSSSNSIDLKAELTAYLAKRLEQGADDAAKAEIGRVIGGTKGNKILDFVSGSPNKPFLIEEASNVFDYDELTKYGYSHLVTPIMEQGGRLAVYALMDMIPPPVRTRPPAKIAPKLVIDRTGETDQARYSGLKMAMDDDAIAQALEEAQRKAKQGERLRPRLEEEDFVMPFADKRNVGPKLAPDWTPELLDEEGKKRGRSEAWARKAKAGIFVSDPYETWTIEGGLRLYSATAALLCALAFGKASPPSDAVTLLQLPALAIVVAAMGSGFVAHGMASEKNRNQALWCFKGFMAGPLAISQLRGLNELITQGENDRQTEESSQLAQQKRRVAQE